MREGDARGKCARCFSSPPALSARIPSMGVLPAGQHVPTVISHTVMSSAPAKAMAQEIAESQTAEFVQMETL